MDTRDKKKLYKNFVRLVAETPVDPVVRHLVEKRIHFLSESGQARKTTGKLLVRYMTKEQNEALAEVVGYIVRGSIRVLPQNLKHFRDRSPFLRQVIDTRISLPRLLILRYLNQAVVFAIRSGEQ